MAKETELFHVSVELNDRDFEDVFQIYLERERGNEKKIGLGVSIALTVVMIVLMIIFKKITFLIYAAACLVIGFSYFFVPANRKFLATNKLQYGVKRAVGFFPHHLTTEEIFEDEEASDGEENEDNLTEIATIGITAYESNRGFLFSDGKIVNNFVYIPKRGLDEETEEKLRKYAEERCSGGFYQVKMTSLVEDDADDAEAEEQGGFAADDCERYYGADKLRLYDDDGHRVDLEKFGESEAEEAPEDTPQAPELDVDAEWEKIIAEESEDE